MIYIELEPNSTKVYLRHHDPEKIQDKSKGFLVESIPEPDKSKVGMIEELHFNPETKEFWYEYYEPTPDEFEQMKQRIELMQQALDELLLNGGM